MKYFSWIHSQSVNPFPQSFPGFNVFQGYSVTESQPGHLGLSNGPRQNQNRRVFWRRGTWLILRNCFLIFFKNHLRLKLHLSKNTQVYFSSFCTNFGIAFNDKCISWTLTHYTYIIWKNYGGNKQQKYEQCQLMKSSHFQTCVWLIKIELSDYNINYINYLA